MIPDLPQPGEVLADRFEVGERLGDGGMAVVMRAIDRTTTRPVALKLLTPRYLGRPEREQRLLDEATYLDALRGNPHIISLVDHGRLAGSHAWPYLATELLAGRALHWLLVDRRFTPNELHSLATQLARALVACHARGIVHRDLTPANVFVDEASMQVTLFDFSHAGSNRSPRVPAGAMGRLTGAHDVPGTDGYMSPEQAMAAPASEPMDVFAFGVVLYELITGRNPFPASDRSRFIQGQRSGGIKVPRLDAWAYQLPEGWADLIEACTALEASERPTMTRVAAWLSELDRVTPPAPPASRVLGLRPASWPSSPALETTERLRETEVRRRQAGLVAQPRADETPPSQPLFARPNAPPIELPELPEVGPVEVTEPRRDEPPPPREASRAAAYGGIALLVSAAALLAWWWPDRLESPSSNSDVVESTSVPRPSEDESIAEPAPTRADTEVERASEAESSTTSSDATESTGASPTSDSPPEPPTEAGPTESEPSSTTTVEPEPRDGCDKVEASGRKALDELDWAAVIRLTAKKRCWSSSEERVRLRVEALMQSRRWAECVEAAEGSADPKVTRWAKFCGKHL